MYCVNVLPQKDCKRIPAIDDILSISGQLAQMALALEKAKMPKSDANGKFFGKAYDEFKTIYAHWVALVAPTKPAGKSKPGNDLTTIEKKLDILKKEVSQKTKSLQAALKYATIEYAITPTVVNSNAELLVGVPKTAHFDGLACNIQKMLGKGSFGQTYKCVDPVDSSKKYVVKISLLTKAEEQDLRIKVMGEHRESQEAEILAKLHLLKGHGFINGRAFMIYKFVEGQLMKEIMEKCGGPTHLLNPNRFEKAMAQALKEFHTLGMSHNDAHLDNYIFECTSGDICTTGTIKANLIDFGFARTTLEFRQKDIDFLSGLNKQIISQLYGGHNMHQNHQGTGNKYPNINGHQNQPENIIAGNKYPNINGHQNQAPNLGHVPQGDPNINGNVPHAGDKYPNINGHAAQHGNKYPNINGHPNQAPNIQPSGQNKYPQIKPSQNEPANIMDAPMNVLNSPPSNAHHPKNQHRNEPPNIMDAPMDSPNYPSLL
jgi:serine/threonine protein kinase